MNGSGSLPRYWLPYMIGPGGNRFVPQYPDVIMPVVVRVATGLRGLRCCAASADDARTRASAKAEASIFTRMVVIGVPSVCEASCSYLMPQRRPTARRRTGDHKSVLDHRCRVADARAAAVRGPDCNGATVRRILPPPKLHR